MIFDDRVRAALIALVSSILPVLQLAGIVHLSAREIAAVMLCVTNVVTLLGLMIKVSPQS